MSRKVIIDCAITGSIHVPSLSSYLPIIPTRLCKVVYGPYDCSGFFLDEQIPFTLSKDKAV